jgi:hypothetical protein
VLDLNPIEEIKEAISTVECSPNVLFSKILETGKDVVSFALGKQGQKLYEIAELVDLDHPHLNNTVQNPEFIIEILELALFAKQKGLSKIFPIEKFKIKMHDIGISLIKDKSKRDELRATKSMQFVNMDIVTNAGNEFWNDQPNDFMEFARNKVPYQDKISLFENKSLCFKDLGCIFLSRESEEELKLFKSNNLKKYYDFNRIAISSVVVILAKLLGYTISVSDKIIISKVIYKEFVDNVGKNGFLYFDGQKENLNYEPRIYPISYFPKVPDRLVKIINYLDNFPQINFKPIFDNYLIVVADPCPESVPGTFSFENRKKYISEFDNTLLEKGLINPVILGEKDNKCYFLCFWN